MSNYSYRPEVLAELIRHGIAPTLHTPPSLVRDFVRDLYKYEIRRLRDRMVAGEFARSEYAGLVDALRKTYPVLALLPEQFLQPQLPHEN